MPQIEGFKLHVAHIARPFTGKIRYTPEVASKPDRLVKDLANAKSLALILEAEYDNLRKMKFEPKTEANGSSEEANGTAEQQDAPMVTTSDVDEEDPEPRERGSDAVERRIEKVMADLREQNALDFSDEKAVEDRRVRFKNALTCACSHPGIDFSSSRRWLLWICTLRISDQRSTHATIALSSLIM